MKEKQMEQAYFLGLQRMPGDTIFIDVAKLGIANGHSTVKLEELDTFTMSVTKDEIITAIKEANLVDPSFLEGTLIIQDNEKHRPLQVIDKSYMDDFCVDTFLKERMGNKSFINNIAYKLGTLSDDKEAVQAFKDSITNGNIDNALQILFSIDYLTQRKFMIYLIDINNKEKQERKEQRELIRDKATKN